MAHGKESVTSTTVDYNPFADDGLSLVVASTEAQKEIWSSIQMDEYASCAFNESVTLKFNGQLNCKAIVDAVNYIVNRHEALRTTFSHDGKNLCISESVTNVIQIHEINADDKQAEIDRYIQSEVEDKFNLENGPLIRFVLLKISNDESFLLITAHHLVCDGWSLGVLINDLTVAYSAFKNQQMPELEHAYPFSEYARKSTAEQASNNDENYWVSLFKRPPEFELPVDNNRPDFRTFNSRRLDFPIDRDIFENLKQTASKLNSSLTSLMLSAYAVCLYRWTGDKDVVIGMPSATQPAYSPEALVGHCVNLLPIRIVIDPVMSFRDLVSDVSDAVISAYEHQNYTFGSLLKKLPLKIQPSRIPLVPVLFNIDHGIQGKDLKFDGLKTEFFSNPRHYENFEIFINASDYGSQFILECQYNTDLFEEVSVTSRLKEYSTVLESCTEDVGVSVAAIDLLSEMERDSEIKLNNNTQTDWENSGLLHEQIDAVAKIKGNNVAITANDVSISYKELVVRSNQFARHLQSKGVSKKALVGICLDRTENMLIALLAVLKTGAAYIPLDPQFPADRITYMIENSGLEYIVTQQNYARQLPDVQGKILIDEMGETLQSYASSSLDVSVNSEDLAYVIYTSGSTGKPKGVMVHHGAVTNFLNSMSDKPGITENDMMLAVTTLSFDIAVLELYLPLIVGARVFIANNQEAKDGQSLINLVEKNAINIMQATPSTWHMMISAGWNGSSALKVLCGGEALPYDLAGQLLDRCSELWNMYGPTETTVWSTCFQVSSNKQLSIGEPIANTQIYILDQNFQVVPRGIAGELYVAGDGVSKGYLNNKALTAERFVTNPFADQPGNLMYRTGDRVKRRFDGSLEFLGRIDSQVKLRGFRIELGEIETVIRQHSLIDDCAVAIKEATTGDSRLVAYIVWSSDEVLSLTDMHQYLRGFLPEYMLPQHLVEQQNLPQTPNGKLDRKQLPDLALNYQNEKSHIAPHTDTEQWLAELWSDILSVRKIGAQNNFFELGGHSLLIAQLIQKIESDKSLHLQYSDIFNYPTLSVLAAHIDDVSDSGNTYDLKIPRRNHDEKNVLSLAQQRLWYLDKIDSGSDLYNLPSAFRFLGALDVKALKNSFSDMIVRHEILRTVLIEEHGEPVQHIVDDFEFSLDQYDFSDIDKETRELKLAKTLNKLQRHAFDLAVLPLFKSALVKMSDEEYILFFMPHHVIFDGWSFDIFLHELTTSYCRYTNAEFKPLEALPIQYADYAAWLKEYLSGEESNNQMQYWIDLLQDNLPVLELPLDKIRPDVASNEGDEVFFEIETDVLQPALAVAKNQDVSLFMLMFSIYSVLLYRYTGQEDIVIGTPMADRTRPGTENLIGFFVNALVLRHKAIPDENFVSMLGRIRDLCLSGFANQDAPFEKLVEVLNPLRDFSRAPLFQTSLTYQDVSSREISMGDIKIEQVDIPTHQSPLDINLWLKRRGDKMQGAVVYSKDLFERETAEQIARHFVRLVASIGDFLTCPVSKITVLTDNERLHELQRNNDTDVGWPGSQLVHEIISRTANKYPDNIAAICNGDSIDYKLLEIKSNQYAHFLISTGVSPGDLIGICVDRSIKMLISLLAIWKTGAAYVPLDPTFPRGRLNYMISDAKLDFIISEKNHLSIFPEINHLFLLEDLESCLNDQSTITPAVAVEAENTAYVIYTSGSTGKPKGVLVQHEAVCNFLNSMAKKPGLKIEDKLLAVTTLSFDIAVLELYLPLVVGAQTIIATKQEAEDGRLLLNIIDNSAVTIMQATPATWRVLIGSGWNGANKLKVFCGGEALSKDLASEILERCDQLWNMYGPTETTVWSSCQLISNTDAAISIGRPIANTRFYVLDEQCQVLPQGVAGELYVGGRGVTKGYLNRPELSAKNFVEDVISGAGKIYKTGDKARYRRDGSLEYLGRMDSQVKVRGYRIELGEIENNLRQHTAIKDCAVAVVEQRSGDARLVAFIVLTNGQSLTVTEVRKYLRELIPVYMVPQHVVELEKLPQTPNAKLDRNILPQLFSGSGQKEDFQYPGTETELWLAELWKDVIGIEKVGVHDNFFDLGGHSLLSMRVITEIFDRAGIELNPRIILLNSLGQIAKSIDDFNKECNAEDKGDNEKSISLLKKLKNNYFKMKINW